MCFIQKWNLNSEVFLKKSDSQIESNGANSSKVKKEKL